MRIGAPAKKSALAAGGGCLLAVSCAGFNQTWQKREAGSGPRGAPHAFSRTPGRARTPRAGEARHIRQAVGTGGPGGGGAS